jgi:hypothetical protein
MATCLTLALVSLQAPAQTEEEEQDPDGKEQPTPPADEEPASTADTTGQCLSSFSAGQARRREGKLIAARDELIRCSQPDCPQEIVAKCTPWLREVKAAIPTVIIVARDAQGVDLADVVIRIDGESLDPKLRGLPIELDPGPHRLVVKPKGHAKIEMPLVVVHSQKNRVVVAEVTPPKPTPPAPPSPPPPRPLPDPVEQRPGSGISPWAWVGFGVGAAGLVAGTVTGALAIDKANELEDTCNGVECSTTHEDDFNEGARLAHASTATFVIGGAGVLFGIAALLWLGDDETAISLGPGRLAIRGRF